MIPQNIFRDRAGKLFDVIAPDLKAGHCRIVFTSEVPGIIANGTGGANAITGEAVARAAGMEFGAAIVLSDEDAQSRMLMADSHFRAAMETRWLGNALHELAHVLDDSSHTERRELSEKKIARASAHCSESFSEKFSEAPNRNLRDLMAHSPKWLRIAMHLTGRATLCGEKIFSHQVAGYQRLFRPIAWGARDILRDEINAMRGALIGEVVATKPPAAWREVVDMWVVMLERFAAADSSEPATEEASP